MSAVVSFGYCGHSGYMVSVQHVSWTSLPLQTKIWLTTLKLSLKSQITLLVLTFA